MDKCIWNKSTIDGFHCELNRAWIVKGECYDCPNCKRKTMELQKLLDIYEGYLKNNNFEKAILAMKAILEYRPRIIDPDWKDIIEEFNRRLSNG